ncbi:MAG: zinc-ribbon domain-containing protein [Clostridia bacterium]|nr:zinc-ribbon domain-containing protein [Clostridia bacterium]MBQ8743490.1 zinc-ribbon domain-containing protein [Clostridia bacterium]
MKNDKQEKEYISDNTQLMQEWDYSKNQGLTPTSVAKYSNKKMWWICPKGHSYQSPAARRASGVGCPYCSGRLVIEGENDLATLRPDLAKQWNFEKNHPLLPSQIKPRSGKKVWWICDKGHEYEDTVTHRTGGRGCPYCSNKRVLKGYNDFETVYPEFAKEWHPTKNGDLMPHMIVAGSHLRVWWQCAACGNEWETAAMKRLGCPACSAKRTTSFPEQAIFFYIKQVYPDAINNYKFEGVEFDIYIPSVNTAIEYDGVFYHKNVRVINKDFNKDNLCKQNGITLFRFRDPKLPKTDYATVIVCTDSYRDEEFENAIKELFGYLKPTVMPNISLEDDKAIILKRSQQHRKENNLISLFPAIAAQWNYEKNAPLTPQYFPPKSNRKVWWKCENGHEWETTIGSRTAGTGCPFCSGNRMLVGENDLVTLRPDIAAEWNYEKNGELLPEQVSVFSNKRVWWKCSGCGFEWITSPGNRDDVLCKKCKSKLLGEKRSRVAAEKNPLCEKYPEIAAQWHPTKNGNLTAKDISCSSGLRAWWICSKGHEWQSYVSNRTKDNLGCPYCGNQKILPGFNDLKSQFPNLAKEWHPTKNELLFPEQVFPKSSKKVWWICQNGHEWEATIGSRTAGTDCPFCSGKRAWAGENDLLTLRPNVAAEWNYAKNGQLTPEKVTVFSNKKVWWKCSEDHEWEAVIQRRSKGFGKCPVC